MLLRVAAPMRAPHTSHSVFLRTPAAVRIQRVQASTRSRGRAAERNPPRNPSHLSALAWAASNARTSETCASNVCQTQVNELVGADGRGYTPNMTPKPQPTFSMAKMVLITVSHVSAFPRRRFAEKHTPTFENSRSTVADVTGQPKYCRTMTARFGKDFAFSSRHLSESHSDLYSICGLRQLQV